MQNVFIYGEKFTNTRQVSEMLATQTGFPLVTDDDIVALASRDHGMPAAKINKAVFGRAPLGNPFTHERQRARAYMKAALADHFFQTPGIYTGLGGHLLPLRMPQLLKVLVTATSAYRTQQARSANHLSSKQARQEIQRHDKAAFQACCRIYNDDDLDVSAYDMVLPMDVLDTDQAVEMMRRRLADAAPSTPLYRQALGDFALTTKVEIALAEKGYKAQVAATDGAVQLTIDHHVILLSKLTEDLKTIATPIDGVRSVEVNVGPHFYQADIYRKPAFEMSAEALFHAYEDRHRRLRKTAEDHLPEAFRHAVRPRTDATDRPHLSV